MLFYLLIYAIVINWIAYKKNYYKLPKATNTPQISTIELVFCFGIYLIFAMLIAPIFARFLLWTIHKANPDITTLPIIFITSIQLAVMIVIFLLLQSYIYQQDKKIYGRIWKDTAYGPNSATEFDFGIGAMTWLLVFPIVSIWGDLLDKILKQAFGFSYYEQTAVKFVKIAATSPFSLLFALLAVLILAPLIEEFLFRGVLQTYLKKRLGRGAAILISALAFSLFHFSPSQGLGNIVLISSLLILGLFLGFLYERQKSLWASIGLHMTFNTISALRILFGEG